jgi:hypothetical protein
MTKLVLQQLHAVVLAGRMEGLGAASAGKTVGGDIGGGKGHSSGGSKLESGSEEEIGLPGAEWVTPRKISSSSGSHGSSSSSGRGSSCNSSSRRVESRAEEVQSPVNTVVPDEPVPLREGGESCQEGTLRGAGNLWVQQAVAAGVEYQTLCLDYGSMALWGLSAAASAKHCPESALDSLTAVGRLLDMYISTSTSTSSSSIRGTLGTKGVTQKDKLQGEEAAADHAGIGSISPAAVCSLCLSLCATASCSSLLHEAIGKPMEVLGGPDLLEQQLQPLHEGLKGVLLLNVAGPEVSTVMCR